MPKKKVVKKKPKTDADIFRIVFIVSSIILGVLTIAGFIYYLVKYGCSFGSGEYSIKWIPFIGVWIPILAAAASNREKEFEEKHEKLLVATIVIGGIAFVLSIIGFIVFLARRG